MVEVATECYPPRTEHESEPTTTEETVSTTPGHSPANGRPTVGFAAIRRATESW